MEGSDFNTEPPEPLEDPSDYSHGAQNFFDSQQQGGSVAGQEGGGARVEREDKKLLADNGPLLLWDLK